MIHADEHFLSILRIFDVPGPRYTSYPTAPVFSKSYGAQQFQDDLSANNQNNNSPLSLYVHIPFCDTLCYFCGCTTIITPNHQHAVEYLQVLKSEISKTAACISQSRPVVQMAWGGGTPSFLSPEEICDLASHFKNHFAFAEDAEISVELDPRELTFDHLKAFVASGANRFSLGVQDFQEDVQKTVNRIQPETMTKQVFTWARNLGIKSINIDLIYGLPLQTVDSFKRTLEKVVALSPERIAVFNFAYVPWLKPHQKLLHVDQLPSPDEKLQLLQLTINTLQHAGYQYIGHGSFCKTDG